MYRSSVQCIAGIFAGAMIASMPLTASAQSMPNHDLTVDEIRADYIAHGYQVAKPITWWTAEHPTTLRVADPTDDRVLMVIVYPDSATAQAALSNARAQDPSDSAAGPHLIPGYGFSTWRQNVAFVESTWDDLSRQYAAEQAREGLTMTESSTVLEEPAAPTYAVDADLLNVMNPEIADL